MSRSSPLASWLAGALLGCAIGCASRLEIRPSAEPYVPDRREYVAFSEAHPDLIEPNYLPFMVHRLVGDEVAGDTLLLCRWPDERMPLPVSIDAPEIGADLQDEFHPTAPEAYVGAARRALERWEAELEELVRFRIVDDSEQALLRLRLLGQRAPAPEPRIRVLGSTALLRACVPRGWDPDSDSMRVSYEVSELLVYVADQHGLLTPDQVTLVAMHELGHALGMSGHSPISDDLMFPILSDLSNVRGLSMQDVNSFLSLYRLPNGAHYADLPPGERPAKPPPGPPTGAPMLSRGPHVDPRFGYELKTPAGWRRVETARGVFVANGPVWDYDASLEVSVWPYPTIEAYLARYARTLFAETWLRKREAVVVNGRPALQIWVEDAEGRDEERFLFIELGDGRVMLILTSCPVVVAEAWRHWYRASLETLEIWE